MNLGDEKWVRVWVRVAVRVIDNSQLRARYYTKFTGICMYRRRTFGGWIRND